MMRYTILTILLASLLLPSCYKSKKYSDLVLINGNIVPVDEKIPNAEGVAIEDDKIVAVGNNNKDKSYIGEDNKNLREHIADYKITNLGNKKLTVRSVKRFIYGALGAHGAWIFEPYNDVPNSTGLPTVSIEYLTESAEIAIENSLQLCTHAT